MEEVRDVACVVVNELIPLAARTGRPRGEPVGRVDVGQSCLSHINILRPCQVFLAHYCLHSFIFRRAGRLEDKSTMQ